MHWPYSGDMTRPLRIQHEDAIYHVTARGVRRNSIFRSDTDRQVWLTMLGETCARFQFIVLAYCQMTNHYHLVLETPLGNLSAGMQYLNARYAQYFNRRYHLSGHVFELPFKSFICDRDAYLKELCRYVVLNPVRAKMMSHPADWPWSSFAAMMGEVSTPRWLLSESILALFGDTLEHARLSYLDFVLSGIGLPSPLSRARNQSILGDELFVETITASQALLRSPQFNRSQRKATVAPLSDFFRSYTDRKEAMARAYATLTYTMQEIGDFCGVSAKTVSRAIKHYEELAR